MKNTRQVNITIDEELVYFATELQLKARTKRVTTNKIISVIGAGDLYYYKNEIEKGRDIAEVVSDILERFKLYHSQRESQ